jgi:dihydrofolate synthase/folylpolyglutamate synthase
VRGGFHGFHGFQQRRGARLKDVMTYQEAMEKLAALGPELRAGRAAGGSGAVGSTLRKFSLDHIRALLQELANPQRSFPSVLIAGTNGKGSTAATLAAIASAAGLRTALYTSPHLLRVNERMKVSVSAASGVRPLVEISDEDFGRLFGSVDAAAQALTERGDLPHYPSYFEMMTAVAFCWFAVQDVELAVLEVGLGGRLDATNSVEPIVSVITDIGIDHTEYLGHTLREIATEKAGILRPDGVLVTLSQHPEANAAIGEAAMAKNVRGVDAARCLPPRELASSIEEPAASNDVASLLRRNRYELSIEREVLRVDSPLAGQHQQRNIALAIATALELRTNHGFAIPNAAIEAGIRATDWPGRLEWIAGRVDANGITHAPLLLDVAHNPAGAWTLRAALAQLPDAMPRTLIFSCLADKQIDEMAQVLLPLFDPSSGDPAGARDHVIFAPIQNPRAANVEDLLAAAHRLDVPAHAAPHVPAALAQAQAVTPSEGVIVVTGSVYLVGELRALALAQ